MFGPTKERVYKQKINKRMQREALFMVLSEKARKDLLIVLEDLNFEKAKTKILVETLKKLPCREQKSLVTLPDMNRNVILAGRNIPQVRTIQARELNVLDLLNSRYIVMPKETVKVIEETFAKK